MRRFVFLLTAVPMIWSASSWAQSVGEWTYQTKDPFYAATINDSGGIFGQWCDLDEKSCFYMVAVKSGCEKDAVYPVLINSDSNSLSTTIVCYGKYKDRGLYRYLFSNFDELDGIARSAKRVGIAMPLTGDEFRVVRFSLQGALAAITSMRSAADRAIPATPARSGTRDQKL